MTEYKLTTITNEPLPQVIKPTNQKISLEEFLKILNRDSLFFKKELLKSGGILFRGFPLKDAHDFTKAIDHLGLGTSLDYIGGDSPRKKIIEGVYTSTEAPPSMKIPLHNELSYAKKYPKHIYFFCEIPSSTGGQTIISDARKIYQDIDLDVKEKFIQKGLMYIARYPHKDKLMEFFSHKSWVNVFETEDKYEVERKSRENEMQLKWFSNDWLEIVQKRAAVISHPETGEKVWFNQLHHYDLNPRLLGWPLYLGSKLLYFRKNTLLHEIFYADGSKIDRKDIYHILDVLDKNTLQFTWQQGDLLVLDNILSMHGRAPFEGKRRILTAMTE